MRMVITCPRCGDGYIYDGSPEGDLLMIWHKLSRCKERKRYPKYQHEQAYCTLIGELDPDEDLAH